MADEDEETVGEDEETVGEDEETVLLRGVGRS